MGRLVAREVSKVFPPRRSGQEPVRALDSVSFELEGHTFVSLVGPSGCGKSTFLNLASAVDEPTGGSIDITADGGGESRIGYVFQEPRLLPWKSIIDNLLYVLDHGDREQRRETARSYLELVGLPETAKMYPGQLSGGMQQRVGIARALSIEPDLLLMDEPFSHLDAISARALRVELQRLWQTTGAAVLFVTHDVMEAVLLSKRVLMMSSAGTIRHDVAIDLPYPRQQTDPEVATHQAEILELFEQMESRQQDAPAAAAAAPANPIRR